MVEVAAGYSKLRLAADVVSIFIGGLLIETCVLLRLGVFLAMLVTPNDGAEQANGTGHQADDGEHATRHEDDHQVAVVEVVDEHLRSRSVVANGRRRGGDDDRAVDELNG